MFQVTKINLIMFEVSKSMIYVGIIVSMFIIECIEVYKQIDIYTDMHLNTHSHIVYTDIYSIYHTIYVIQ